MNKFALVICLLLVSASSHAQLATEFTIAGVTDCMKEAIETNSVENSGGVVVFSCNTVKARTLFNFLGRKIRIEVVQDKNGKFENRQLETTRVTTGSKIPAAKAADEFRCDLVCRSETG